jgi:hypothetical protein
MMSYKEFEEMWKDAFVAYFVTLSQNFDRMRKTVRNFRLANVMA